MTLEKQELIKDAVKWLKKAAGDIAVLNGMDEGDEEIRLRLMDESVGSAGRWVKRIEEILKD